VTALQIAATSSFRVKDQIWTTGERIAFTVGSDGTGAHWPTFYAVTRLRASGHSSNTLAAKARVIASFHRWADDADIDVIERLQGLTFFRLDEIESLRWHLRRGTTGKAGRRMERPIRFPRLRPGLSSPAVCVRKP
jgi:hypothetical protein